MTFLPKPRVTFLSSSRYASPLPASTGRKFALLARVADVWVIGLAEGLRPARLTQHARFYLLPRLPFAPLRYATMFVLAPALALWLILRHGVRIMIAQGPYEGVAGAWVRQLARWLGRPCVLVVESHGDFEEALFHARRVRPAALYRRLMTLAARFALERADIVRAVSDSTLRQLRRWTAFTPAFQFPAWTDLDRFFEAAEQGKPEDTAEVIYAGVLGPHKGVHHLVEAFRAAAGAAPRARLILLGSAEDQAYAARLRRRVDELGLTGRVHFLGPVPQEELARRIRQALVLVLPSHTEGFGRVLIEAMAAGTPVISTRVGGVPEIVEEGVTGFLVAPGDEGGLADRLGWALDHPGEAREMGVRAHEAILARFSVEGYLEGYAEVFRAAEALLARPLARNADSPL